MAILSFGQPDNGVIQMCYVVRDLAAGMAQWGTLLRTGPWFVLRKFAGVDPRFRGNPATARCDVAFAFVGHMQIELVEQKDSEPSHFRYDDGSLREGFHHFGMAAKDFDGDSARLEAQGFEKVFTAAVPSGGRVAVYDTKGAMPGMIELIEADDELDKMFTGMYQASLNWDGSDPVREIAIP